MRMYIEIDENLIAKAQKIGNIKTKKATVEKALLLFIRLENQKNLMEMFGKVKFFDTAD